jgi:ATP-binding cassette subfamily B protein
VGYLFAWAGTRSRLSLSMRMGFVFDAEAAELAASMPGLEHLESPEQLDRHQMVTQGSQALGGALNDLLNLVSTLIKAVTVYLTMATVSPLLTMLGLLGLPSLWLQARLYGRSKAADEDAAPRRRLALSLEAVMASPAGGREMRVFGIAGLVSARRHDEELEAARIVNRVRLKVTPAQFGLDLIGSSAMVIGVLYTLSLAYQRRATAGDVALVLMLAASLPAQLTSISAMVGSLARRSLLTVSRLLWLIDYADEQKAKFSGTATPPGSLADGIVLEGVSFRYPGTEAWVMRDFSARLDAGSVTAVVGDNGAGKTTLVKLLCRFYDPDEGRILVDGVDLRELDIEAWRARLTMANQDFAKLELLARASVGVGDLPRVDDEAAVAGAVGRAGGTDVVDRLEQGLATQLGRQWEGGTDLSTGQWQKLALARGLMRSEPLLQLLDEPTASLDAGTEHALFERLTAAARHVGALQRGTVTVLVSHRFSTVRAADRILVIEGGRLVEDGTHDELVRADGLYAELYEIQAASYR